MKQLFLTFICLLSCFPLLAQNKDCLLVHFHDGSSMAFLLESRPKLSFASGVVTIATEHYRFGNIRKYTFEDATGIGSVFLEDAGDNYRVQNNVLYIKKGKESTPIELYTVDGKKMPVPIQTNDSDMITINLSAQKSGVYLLKVGEETLKINIR